MDPNHMVSPAIPFIETKRALTRVSAPSNAPYLWAEDAEELGISDPADDVPMMKFTWSFPGGVKSIIERPGKTTFAVLMGDIAARLCVPKDEVMFFDSTCGHAMREVDIISTLMVEGGPMIAGLSTEGWDILRAETFSARIYVHFECVGGWKVHHKDRGSVYVQELARSWGVKLSSNNSLKFLLTMAACVFFLHEPNTATVSACPV